ncbi:MAG TPA: SURF1 family protein [Candidatus Binatia bacterium]|nr:SURF1 family protein [Candidatus Binatia bacterium]
MTRPGRVWWLAPVAAIAFASAGAWQVQRGLAKRELQRHSAEAWRAPAGTLKDAAAAESRHVEVHGTWLGDRQVLQDGQAHGGQPGFHVWTPLRSTDNSLVMVDRGWIPLPAPASLPVPAGVVAVQGLWRTLPAPALRLPAGECVTAPHYPAIAIYPDAARLRCLLGERVLDGLLLLDAVEPDGFVREWQSPGFPPERHYAYAAQWFGLAALAMVMFVRRWLRR